MGFIRDNFLGGSEKRAAKRQIQAGDRAIETAEEADKRARQDLQPFRNAGKNVLRATSLAAREQPADLTDLRESAGDRVDLTDLTEAAGDRVDLASLFEAAGQGPDEDFERSELFRSIQNSAAAGGKLRSGGTLTALLDRGKALDARFRGERFDRLFRATNLDVGSRNERFGRLFDTTNLDASTRNQRFGRLFDVENLDSSNRTTRFNKLFNLSTLGANAAARQATGTLRTGENVGRLQVGQGDAAAAGVIGKKNAQRGTINDIVSFLGKVI